MYIYICVYIYIYTQIYVEGMGGVRVGRRTSRTMVMHWEMKSEMVWLFQFMCFRPRCRILSMFSIFGCTCGHESEGPS